MDINNYTENACTRNASKVHGKNLCCICNNKVFFSSVICKFIAFLKNSRGPAGLNLYAEPPGFRQFISFSRKLNKSKSCLIPHVLVFYYDKANQGITNDV